VIVEKKKTSFTSFISRLRSLFIHLLSWIVGMTITIQVPSFSQVTLSHGETEKMININRYRS
jgi:hypothetical protein